MKMTQETILLPQNSWKKILPYIKKAGEQETIDKSSMGDDFEFLETLGFFSKSASGELTEIGKSFFEAAFIRCDGSEYAILQESLLRFAPTTAVQQYLWGVKNVNTSQVLTVLKATGFWFYDSIEPLTHFLDLLNFAGIVKYGKKTRSVEVLISPDTPHVPMNIFIDPSRPFSNIVWIKRALGECESFIYWLDKHFQKEALEWLWAVADANKITEIKILSLDLGDVNLGKEARKAYHRFKQELSGKGIKTTWATIDSKLIRDAHDRWIVGGNDYLRNVPDVNSISSGSRSEMNRSDNHDQVLSAFQDYWAKSTEVA